MSRKRKDIPTHKSARRPGRAKVDRSFEARGLSCIIVPPTAKSYRLPRTDTSIRVFDDDGNQIKTPQKPVNIIRKLRKLGVIT